MRRRSSSGSARGGQCEAKAWWHGALQGCGSPLASWHRSVGDGSRSGNGVSRSSGDGSKSTDDESRSGGDGREGCGSGGFIGGFGLTSRPFFVFSNLFLEMDNVSASTNFD